MRRRKDELAVTGEAADGEEAVDKKQGRKNLFKTIGGVIDTVNVAMPRVTDFYLNWIKPVWTNRAQIKRRVNALTTVISLIFFIIYVPLLLFGKVAEGLHLGWAVALYVCVGVYFVMLVVLLAVALCTGKSNTTESDKKKKLAYRIVLLAVRLFSLAVAITALVISTQAESSPLNTLAMVVAIISIIFSLIPIIFGGIAGFFKWLISPASATVKRPLSFVALEWNQMLVDNEKLSKGLKKAYKKHGTRVDACLDKYILPALGKEMIRSIDGEDVEGMLSTVPEKDLNITEWATKSIFSYAESNGYIDENPCEELNLQGDIELERRRSSSKPKDI